MQKNYYLHQSAKDGFRSYIQAYASYSLKQIFNVHNLDLAKVGKAFGFTVPPRINVLMGEGTGGGGRTGPKRKRDNEDGNDEEIRNVPRDRSKARRREQLGKKVDKEIYRKKRLKSVDGAQWST